MYGSDATPLREMVRSDPAVSPARNARLSGPRDVPDDRKVTLSWLVWQVAREEVEPREAAWAMCPDVDPMTSGFTKLLGHTTFVFQNWLIFYRECGWEKEQEERVKRELRLIWGLQEDRPCRLRQKR